MIVIGDGIALNGLAPKPFRETKTQTVARLILRASIRHGPSGFCLAALVLYVDTVPLSKQVMKQLLAGYSNFVAHTTFW